MTKKWKYKPYECEICKEEHLGIPGRDIPPYKRYNLRGLRAHARKAHKTKELPPKPLQP